ncbi:hypothetical protein [Arthrobacter sp. NA-172]|uniref:hypothetical protein n=1 Tax=Arthrobacter sp. NA-172 TaxID=3367524 RepID=UPI0037544FF0
MAALQRATPADVVVPVLEDVGLLLALGVLDEGEAEAEAEDVTLGVVVPWVWTWLW